MSPEERELERSRRAQELQVDQSQRALRGTIDGLSLQRFEAERHRRVLGVALALLVAEPTLLGLLYLIDQFVNGGRRW